MPNLKSSYRTRSAFGNQKMEKGLIVQGTMDNTHDGSHEIANRVYFRGGVLSNDNDRWKCFTEDNQKI